MVQRWWLVGLLCAAACATPKTEEDSNAGVTTTAPPMGAAECKERIKAPDPFDLGIAERVDPHEEVYGAAEPDPYHVHLSYPSTDTSTSIAVLWRTDVDTLATVMEYGEGEALDQRIESSSYRFGGSDNASFRVHEVKLCGRLKPNTTYSYRVGGEGHWSKVYRYTTPPDPGPLAEGETFKVAFAGDSRGAYEQWGLMLAKMNDRDPDLFVFSGDMVDLGNNQDEWDGWFEAAGDVLAERVLVPAHGNHEFLASNYFALFSLPNNEEWFQIRYRNLHLVSLNDTVRDQAFIEENQVTYLDDAYSSVPDASWRLLMHHKTMYGACTTHGSNEGVRDLWAPILDKHEVDLVVAGHNHTYERSVPIRNGEKVDRGEGTLYVVSGGAGAPLYTGVEDTWFNKVSNPTYHYIIGTFSETEASFKVYDMSENVIDRFTIPR